MKNKLILNDYLQDNESLMYPPIKKKVVKKLNPIQSSIIPESQVQNKKTILKDKKIISKKIIHQKTTNSYTFKILPQESILKEKVCSPFWKECNKEKYNVLSWLQKIDWQGLDSTLSNGYAINTTQKSWFSIKTIQHQPKNLEKIYYPSFKYIVVNEMEKEDIPKKITKSLKLRLFPTSEQKKLLNKWAGSSRYTYNKTLATLKNPKNNTINWKKLRNRFVTCKNRLGIKNNFFNNKKWLLDVPKSIRLSAVKECCIAYRTAFKNLKNGNIKQFDLKFKTKKRENVNGWSLQIEKNNVKKENNELYIFKETLGKIKYGRTKQLHKLIPNNKPLEDPKIQKDKFGDYYLILSSKKEIKKPLKKHNSITSWDPGVSIFNTGYSPLGKAYMIGKNADKKLSSLLEKLDNLISNQSQYNKKSENYKNIKLEIIRLRKKIYNYKKELHNQSNNLISKSATLILYPKLETKKLSLKENRQLKTKTVRKMLNLGHCDAFNKLKNKCLENGSLLIKVEEDYTSQTCHCCGNLNKCNDERIFKCSCGYKAERDLNGSLNILLKNILE